MKAWAQLYGKQGGINDWLPQGWEENFTEKWFLSCLIRMVLLVIKVNDFASHRRQKVVPGRGPHCA